MLSLKYIFMIRNHTILLTFTNLTLTILFLGSFLFFVTTTNAADCTNAIEGGDTVPLGYGAAYNPLTTTKDLLVQTLECPNNISATITVGVEDQPDQYAYKSGYYWDDYRWQPYTLAGDTLINNAWYNNIAGTNIPVAVGHTRYFVGYTCALVNGAWKCGCRDAACTTAYWQLQGIIATPSSGGGGGGGGGGGTIVPGVCVVPPTLSNPLVYTNKCPDEAGGPGTIKAGGRDVLIELPTTRVCDGGINLSETGNVHIKGGVLKLNGYMDGINMHSIPANKTLFIEGVEVDGNNQVADLIRTFSMGANTTLVVQNTYVHGQHWAASPHADCVHNQGGGALGKLILQNFSCYDTGNNGLQVIYAPSSGGVGARSLFFDRVDISKGPGKTGGLVNFGGTDSGNYGYAAYPPDGAQITALYSEMKVKPDAVYKTDGTGDCKQYGTWTQPGVQGKVCIGRPAGGNFAPSAKVGLNYDRSAFCK